MPNSRVELRGYIENLTYGSISIFKAVTNSDSPGDEVSLVLVSGYNQITPPTNLAKGVIIALPTAGGSVTSRILKGVTGDTGILLSLEASFIVIPFDSANIPTELGITLAGGNDTDLTSIRYF